MPHRFDRMIFPGFEYGYPSSETELIEELSQRYLEDAQALRKFAKHTQQAFTYLAAFTTIRSLAGGWLNKLVLPVYRLMLGFDPNSSLQAYLNKRFRNPELKALLAAQWGDYGVPPNEASFMVHAMIWRHFLDGAFYPEGGQEALVKAMHLALSKTGVHLKLNTAVTQILTRDNRAYGVKTVDKRGHETVYEAPYVISNTGALSTYRDLLSQHTFPFLQGGSNTLVPTHDFFSIYLSLNDSPEKLGFDGANYWIFRTLDHSQTILHPDHPDFPGFYCVFFPSLKSGSVEEHSVEILTRIPYRVFEPWENQPTGERDESYYALKERIVARILADVESRYPGFGELIAEADSSSPLTTRDFLSREHGASYGIPYTTERMHLEWLSSKTPIRQLFLSGQDTMGPGVTGAMMGGVSAAALVLGGKGYPNIMKHVSKHVINREQQPVTREYPVSVE